MHNIAYFGYLFTALCGVVLIYWLARKQHLPTGLRPGRDLPAWLVCVGCLVLFLFERVSFRATWPPADFWDFVNAYYPAGHAVLYHDDASLRELIGKGTTGFVNIPVAAYLFAPFAMLPPTLASIALTFIGVGLLVVTWSMLCRLADLELRERWLLALLFLINGPLMSGLKYGNLSYFVLPALAGGLLLLRSNRSFSAGVLLGLATVIKPPLVIFGLFFLFRKDWRGLGGYALVGVTTVILSVALFGWTDNWQWFQVSILHYSSGWMSAFNVQSMPAFILRVQPDAPLTEWLEPQMPTAVQKLVAQIFIGLCLLTTVFACVRLKAKAGPQGEKISSERRDLQYQLVICLCVILSPLTWSHYYAWLLMPAAFFIGSTSTMMSQTAPRVAGWTAIALVTPLIGEPWRLGTPILMAAYRIFAMSHFLFGGIAWFGLIAWWLAGTFVNSQKPASVSKPIDERYIA